ncbi:MAG: hydroxymethylbilane synthase [Candidatus Puniceispirillum sp.]|nr:hydroxymethylbilane synthase [Candidatus Pelagibacter sp.]MBA4283458.1 hydroxymethylbilane synthase [Candidatus Puniceispirillum sp.]
MIILGTRESPLALVQARRVESALQSAQHEKQVKIIPMKTQGDRLQIPLADIGGKYLFTKELQEALIAGKIDGAVHSLKDVEDHPLGTVLGAFIERQNPFDVMIIHKDFKDIDRNTKFTIGTCSPRRKLQIMKVYPECIVKDIRGNVGSRLNKVSEKYVDAIILAKAGLNRLDIFSDYDLNNLHPNLMMVDLPSDIMVPAAGQGIIVLECAPEKAHLFRCINNVMVEKIALTERMFVKAFNGNCRTALSAFVYSKNAESDDYIMDGFYKNMWKSLVLKDFLHRDLGSLQQGVEKFVSSFKG